MPPITKENETLSETPESLLRSGSAPAANGEAGKQQPVALEVAVTVNGARSIEGSDKREPFSETTKTVLIFGNGAVIRLTSSVSPGQLLFLTNERTKKEVVCQVVKSKNYKNVSGYVELEFTEPVVGFWGMRFPADRIGPGPQAGSAAIPSATVSSPAPAPPSPVAVNTAKPAEPKPAVPATPVPTKLEAPAANLSTLHAQHNSSIAPPPINSASLLGASKPKLEEFPLPATPAAAAPKASPVEAAPGDVAPPPTTPFPTSPNFHRRQSDQPASFLTPKTPATVDLSSVAPFFEVRPATPAEAPPAAPQKQAASDSQTEDLRQHTARLQEQLSHLEFSESAPGRRTPTPKQTPEISSTPPHKDKELQESIAHVLEVAKTTAPKSEEHFVQPVKTASEKKSSSTEGEELKIPAWLEPLARNTSTPTSTQELAQREKAKRLAEQIYGDELPAEPESAASPSPEPPAGTAAPEEEPLVEQATAEFEAGSEGEERSPELEEETESKGPNKGLLFGAIAAAVALAVVGGWWYLRQSHSGIAVQIKPPSAPAITAPLTPKPSGDQGVTEGAAQPESAVTRSSPKAGQAVASNANSAGPARGSLSPAAVRNSQAAPSTPAKGNAAAASNSPQPESDAAAGEAKKTGLGEVHLAAPKVSQNRNAPGGAEADAGVSVEQGQSAKDAEALGASLAIGNNQPSAPAATLPIGGDVKQAKLISQAPLVYPILAKNQHVSGNVTIDALIDVNGRVTTMKVMSGPTLLHQAALDSLKQWKYQPALLDGKPVPMHLTVTLQFRLQ